MTTSATVPGWTPIEDETEIDWFRPVPAALGERSKGITACSLPDGRAIVVWVDDPRIEFAVVDNMGALLGNDVVTAGMVQTAVTAGHSADRCSVFSVDGAVYLIVVGSTAIADRWWTRLYILDDPLSPTTWTLRSTIQAGTDWTPPPSGRTNFGGALTAGIPLVLDSGRWVLNGIESYIDAFFTSDYGGRVSAIWTSDNEGLSWTLRGDFNDAGDIGRNSDNASPQIARHPVSGRLYAGIVYPAAAHRYAYSTDDGTTWTSVGGAPMFPLPFLDNEVDLYAAATDDLGSIYTFNAATNTWVDTGRDLWFDSSSPNQFDQQSQNGEAAKIVPDLGGLYAFVGPWIAAMGLRGWQHGSVAFG